MSVESGIKVNGEVIAVLGDALFRVRLANGHELLGHLSRSQKRSNVRFEVGETVMLQVSPYDLSKGRILEREKFV